MEIMHIIFAMFVQVNNIRNLLFHSSSFQVEHNATKNMIQQMIELLEAKDLADDTAAKHAVKCLEEVSNQRNVCDTTFCEELC